MYAGQDDGIAGVVGNALGPSAGAEAIGAGAHELWEYYGDRRFMEKYYAAKAKGPIEWVVDENGEPVLDGFGHPIWVPAPNPMVVAAQDALEWHWRVSQRIRMISGLIVIPLMLLCLYWTF